MTVEKLHQALTIIKEVEPDAEISEYDHGINIFADNAYFTDEQISALEECDVFKDYSVFCVLFKSEID